MARVFISYRREDSAGHAGRLYDDLVERFGRERVFMDIDHLYPGVDWAEAIEDAIGDTGIMLVVIGRHWSTVTGTDGERRLDNPDDFLRLEIALALARNVRVIPILVQGTSMPKAADLPEDLRLLARRHAFELSDSRWAYDVGRLTEAIQPVLDEGRLAQGKPVPPTTEASSGAETAPGTSASRSVTTPSGRNPRAPNPSTGQRGLAPPTSAASVQVDNSLSASARLKIWLSRINFRWRQVLLVNTLFLGVSSGGLIRLSNGDELRPESVRDLSISALGIASAIYLAAALRGHLRPVRYVLVLVVIHFVTFFISGVIIYTLWPI